MRELLQLGTLLREYGGPVVERETELIETARAATAAFNRAVAAGAGEREVEAYLELVAADIRLHTITRIASGEGVIRGHEEARAYFRRFREVIEDCHIDDRSYRLLDDGRVLILGTWRLRGRASGADVEEEWASVSAFDEGLMIEARAFGNHADALRQAGLEEG